MDTNKFITAYNESRNGTNKLYRHPLARSFLYSDGIKECADAGCHWLVDIMATELPGAFTKRGLQDGFCVVDVTVADAAATIRGAFEDDDPDAWFKQVEVTDLPEGNWTFYVHRTSHDGLTVAILPTEY